ncbi:MAG: carboxypeptidase regulatory-like domain-containing protein [Gemmatimonadaceae bacterium]|nr:carboxypeptidase regulatory-like domain-containing protein [Gemmatimonadaceae bacterium]
MRFVVGAAALLAAVTSPSVLGAQAARPDTLVGRVTTDSAFALDSAEVIVTRGPDRAVFRTRTGADGRWRLVIDAGTGDYLVYVTHPGRVAQRTRVTRKAAEQRLTVDLALAAVPVQRLARVEVRASKRKPPERRDGLEPARGGAEIARDGVTGALSPVQQGDIAAQALTIPGLQSGPGGLSALGLPGDQTLVTLNGLGFAGGEVPRGMRTGLRVATTAWDVTRGGFSGAQVDLELSPAWIFSTRNANVALDAPWLQLTDAIGRALGARYGRLDAALAASGAIGWRDRLTYAAGATVRRSTDESPSIATASDAALGAVGVPRDTVARFLGELARLGIPVGEAQGTTRTDVILTGRLDRPSYNPKDFSPMPRTMGMLGYLKVADARGVALSPSATPATSATSRDVTGVLQFQHSLRTQSWLHDSRVALSLVDARTSPALELPSGSVRTAGATAASGGIATLGFGGNDRLASDRTLLTVEAQHESQVFATTNERHRLKLFGQLRADASTQRALPGGLGSYTYNSIDDLVAGRPAAFSRTLVLPEREGRAWNAAFGIGSIYRRDASFSLQYGARVEAGGFLARPDANDALTQSLNVRTNVAPAELAVLPRLGVRWVYSKRDDNRGGMTYTPIGTRIENVVGVLRGGVGLFRNFVGPDAIAGAVAATGLPGSTLRLDCVGAAIPAADWDAFAASPANVPARCAGPALPLVQPAAQVRALDPSWRTPRSWRANLGWTTRLGSRTDVTIEGIASLNLSQPSVRDANFAAAQQATLAGEGGRPLFVAPSLVVPGTGAISPLASRADAAFGSVLVAGAQGRSLSTQFRLVLDREFRGPWQLRGAYVLGRVRERLNGFDRNTAADPRAFEWAPGDIDVRHQLQLQGGTYFKRISVSAFVDMTSGRPFTPLVSGDVNGDGSGFNDRAFVARAAGDPGTAAAITSLLAGAPGYVRDCLGAAADRIAPRNGCRGPWEARMNLQVGLSIPRRGAFAEDLQLSLFVENPLGGLDRLVNGDDIRGWGSRAAPDPVLLAVREWDAAAQRFRYAVNPRFGATDPRLSTIRAPFRVTLNLSVPFGPTVPEQQLSRALRPGRNGFPGPRPDSASLHARYARNVGNPIRAVLYERDSLLLTPEQVAALEPLEREFQQRADSMWSALAAEFARYSDAYNSKAALARQEVVIDAVWELARVYSARLTDLLTPVQHKLLPWPARVLRTAKPGVKIRIFAG